MDFHLQCLALKEYNKYSNAAIRQQRGLRVLNLILDNTWAIIVTISMGANF